MATSATGHDRVLLLAERYRNRDKSYAKSSIKCHVYWWCYTKVMMMTMMMTTTTTKSALAKYKAVVRWNSLPQDVVDGHCLRLL